MRVSRWWWWLVVGKQNSTVEVAYKMRRTMNNATVLCSIPTIHQHENKIYDNTFSAEEFPKVPASYPALPLPHSAVPIIEINIQNKKALRFVELWFI